MGPLSGRAGLAAFPTSGGLVGGADPRAWRVVLVTVLGLFRADRRPYRVVSLSSEDRSARANVQYTTLSCGSHEPYFVDPASAVSAGFS